MLIGTINFFHFIPLSVTLAFAWGHEVNQTKTCYLHFLAHFELIRMKSGMVLKQFKLEILILFLSEI